MSTLNFKDIAKIFEEIELRLISSLKRNLKRHKAEEQRYGFEWSAWQAEKLKNMENFRRENLDIMNEYVDVIDDQTRQLMTEQFQEGQQQAQRSVQELSDEPITPIPDKHFFGVNEKKMAKLMEDVTTLEKTAETAALRMTDDIYRQTLNRVQLAMGTGSMTLNEAIDLATRDFLDKGINCIVYADGKRVNIADYVRMALRTTSTRAALQGAAKRFAELGYDTVLVSQYGGCSKTCEPWQGQVYIDDVFTVWEGEKDEFQGKSNYCGEWFWLLSYAVKNGLFHPNCRHTMTQYIHGRTQIPEPIPAEKIAKQRQLEQKQRAMERKVRKLKRFAAGTCDPDTAKEYRRKLRQAQHELKAFVEEHNEVLHRDYSREKYYGGGVDKSVKSDIMISEQSKKPITVITDKAIENVPKVKIDGYTGEQCELIQQNHKDLLKYSRDNNDSKEVAFVMDSSLSSRKEFLGSDDKLDFGNELYGKDLFVMHNHPRNSSFSDRDIRFIIGNDNIRTLSVIKNNGNIEVLSKSGIYEKERALIELRRCYKKYVNRGTDEEINKAISAFLKNNKGMFEWTKK